MCEDDRQFDRVLWRSRRGLLELDLVLVDFAKARYPLLSCADQDAYRGVLAQDDWTIWEWLRCRATPPAAFARIVELIADFVADDARPGGESAFGASVAAVRAADADRAS